MIRVCNCVDACGSEWLIVEGNQLTMQNCVPTVDALRFEWAVTPSSSHYHHRLHEFDPNRKYEHRHWERDPNIDIIDGKNIPFYPCEIPQSSDEEEEQFNLEFGEPQQQGYANQHLTQEQQHADAQAQATGKEGICL